MTINFSKFNPDDFLPILGTTCPRLEDLQTGDLLFPRLSDAAGGGVNASVASQKPAKNALKWWGKKDTLRSLLKDDDVVAELLYKADKTDKTAKNTFAERRALDLRALKEELQRNKDKRKNKTLTETETQTVENEITPIDLDSMLRKV